MKNHSDAYIDFIKQIDATGYQKAQGYDPDLFNKISDSERNEVEQKDIRDNSYYYLNNAHGDVVGLVDSKGTVVNSYKYDAFGNIVEAKEQVHNRFKYAGEQYDQVTGQYYLRARFYNPVVGRFTQEDTYRGDGLNLYSYVSNNLVKYVDPSGYCGESKENVYAGAGEISSGISKFNDPYAGVKQASEYLKSQGVPRKFRKQIIESFDVKTISMNIAGENTYGMRFHDFGVNAQARGRYLFESFNPLTNKNNLALPYEWNKMTGIKQWKISPGTEIIKGNTAPQFKHGSQFIGGEKQWYINNLDNLLEL